MLFFRSEELVRSWCEKRGVEPRPLVTMDQLWQLAVAWYGTRLDPDARRPSPAEMGSIFETIGLGGDFWDPTADLFRGS